MLEATILSSLRAAVVVATLAVAACAESTPDGPVAAAPAARPAAGARTNYLPPAPPPVVASTPVMSVEKARSDCWMKLEADKKAPKDLDKRVKLVETCVGEKMSSAPTTKEP